MKKLFFYCDVCGKEMDKYERISTIGTRLFGYPDDDFKIELKVARGLTPPELELCGSCQYAIHKALSDIKRNY